MECTRVVSIKAIGFSPEHVEVEVTYSDDTEETMVLDYDFYERLKRSVEKE